MSPLPGATIATALIALAPGAVAQALSPFEREIAGGTVLRFSGQINMGVLSYDDGSDTETYAPVDNDNSSSRARLQIFSEVGEWDMEAKFEAQYQPRASGAVSQLDDSYDWHLDRGDIRVIEAAFAHERYGTFRFGQGSMASDSVAETDLSGTGVIAYSSVADPAGGQFFRFDDGSLSTTTVGSAFANYDGLGREVRIRYDTPAMNGFRLRTSYGQDLLAGNDDSLYDVAATYSREFPDFEIAASLGYAWDDGTDVDLVSGSLSARHRSGVSLTLASGAQRDAGSGRYGYAKVGYERDFFEIGPTAFSADYYLGEDVAADAAESRSYGLAAVQQIDSANLELWLVWRNYALDDPDNDYRDGRAVFGGVRYVF